jgi:hypothetical protein
MRELRLIEWLIYYSFPFMNHSYLIKIKSVRSFINSTLRQV